ncbi:hypothetical protein [Halobaculum limi]|uniref:hypothetical protein n=1 Tax=Halobaculum limi TaxID=3031916 RepID=UPI00240749DD|nr:hypothetical protein [Halobaculum sp. YSMS11]
MFDLADPFVLGLLLVAIAPGAPFIPQLVAMAGEDSKEAVHLTVALTLVATVTVPLIVATLLTLFGVDIRFSPW